MELLTEGWGKEDDPRPKIIFQEFSTMLNNF
jgi:hypothetical protein